MQVAAARMRPNGIVDMSLRSWGCAEMILI